MLYRWNELGKPLFIIPRDFRDRIIIGIGDKTDKATELL
jgi:hypothetical protein